MSNLNNVFDQSKFSKNNEVNHFMSMFLYHNQDFFKKCVKLGINDTNDTSLDHFKVGIHYECGPHKWGSVGLMNQMIKRGHIEIVKDHRNNCYCLDATVKLVNRILNNCYRTMENFKCISEGRYDDRKLNPCR